MSGAMNLDLKVQLGDVLTPRAFLPPAPQAQDPLAQLAAFNELSMALVNDPAGALRRILEVAMRLCRAGSAGLSLLRPNRAGIAIVRWESVIGKLAEHEGLETARDRSPCGACLDAGGAVLIRSPERAFAGLHNAPAQIVEYLVAPVCGGGEQAIGTIWLAHHDAASSFSSEDASILEVLAVQAVLGLKLSGQSRENGYAVAMGQSHQRAQRDLLVQHLDRERRLRERAEASDSESRQLLRFKETAALELNHRIKNTLQIVASLLSLHARMTSSAEVRAALEESRNRLRLLAKVHEMLCTDSTQAVLMPPLLHAMADALRESFQEVARRVELRITSAQIVLSADDAIPLALLANEVMTNAYKHAFADGASGMIVINLSCEPQNAVVLRIMDDGVGMRVDECDRGLGMKLVRSLAAQLRATLSIEKPPGTSGTVMTLRIHRSTPPPA